MGRGNFCPCGKLTYQWYINNDLYEIDDYEYDFDTMMEDVNYAFSEIEKKFPSFHSCKRYLDHYWGQECLLENNLFEIGIADNQYSLAVWIKEKDLWPESYPLAEKHFENYKNQIQEILLNIFGTISLRNGPWMSTEIRREHETSSVAN